MDWLPQSDQLNGTLLPEPPAETLIDNPIEIELAEQSFSAPSALIKGTMSCKRRDTDSDIHKSCMTKSEGQDESTSVAQLGKAVVNCVNHTDEEGAIECSKELESTLVKKVLENTLKSNEVGMKTFALFVLALVNYEDANKEYRKLSAAESNPTAVPVPGRTDYEKFLTRIIVNGRAYSIGFDNSCLFRPRHFLIEFVVGYASKRDRKEVNPATTLTNIRGINRKFINVGFPTNLFTGPIFSNPKTGLVAALENRYAEQQARGSIRVSYNALTEKDVETILSSTFCDPRDSTGYCNRFLLGVGLSIASRTTELAELLKSQFVREKAYDEDSLVFYPVAGSINGR